MSTDIHLNGALTETEAPLMDLEDIERRAYREASLVELDHRRGVFTSIYNFKGPKAFALECGIAAHGYWQILPAKDFVQLARRWHVTKANVQKLVEKIQKDNGLPPVPGQREAAGKRNMSRSRKQQLKTK